MLGSAFEVSTVPVNDVVLVVVAALGLGQFVARTVDAVGSARAGAAGLPFDVLENVGAINYDYAVLPLRHLLGDRVVDVPGFRAVQVIQFVGHLLKDLDEGYRKIVGSEVVDADTSIRREHILVHDGDFGILLFR